MSEESFKDKFNILIMLFIKKGNTFAWNSKDYSRECAAAKRLVSKYYDFDFFYFIPELYNNFNSLLGLTGKYWSKKIDEKFSNFLLDKQKNKSYTLSDNTKYVDIEQEIKKPNQTLMEFLSEK